MRIYKSQNAPRLRSSNLVILASSSSGRGPRRSSVGGIEAVLLIGSGVPGRGVPARELLAVDVGWGRFTGAVFAPTGGADIGRVLISRVGSLPPAGGSTSSRFTGIPRAMRCCRRIRERVQLTGLMMGGEGGKKLSYS